MTATDETRFHHALRLRWGVVCGDGEVVWARDEAAARRLLASLVGAIRIVCEEAPAEAIGAEDRVPGGHTPSALPPMARPARPYPH